MTEKETHPKRITDLRRQAEETVREKEAHAQGNLDAMSPEEIQQTLHELRVHQIELEIQNQELRLTQEKLEAARTRYFDLYDMAPVGYVTTSREMVITEANLTIATLLGVRRVDLVGQPLSQFIAKEEQGGYYLHLRQLFETGEPQSWALRMVKKDGTAFWSHLEASTTPDGDGDPVCRAAVIDITASKQVEEEIRKRDSKYRELVERAQDGIFTITVQGQFLLVNTKFCQMLGYTLEECLRRNILDTYPDDMRPVGTQRLADLQSGQALRFERPMKRQDGGIVFVEAIAWKDSDGNVQAIVRDITERNLSEEELREASKIERSSPGTGPLNK